jgi:hypothetical protein
VNRFTRQTLPTVNKKYFFMNILLKHGHQFDYWNQPLNMRMRVCYLDYHEVGLCCYLVLYTEKLLRSLQLFYFHLWPIYWLFRVVPCFKVCQCIIIVFAIIIIIIINFRIWIQFRDGFILPFTKFSFLRVSQYIFSLCDGTVWELYSF